MNLIYARYNMYHNSIDITTFDGYILRIDCNKAEKGLKNTAWTDHVLNALAIDNLLETCNPSDTDGFVLYDFSLLTAKRVSQQRNEPQETINHLLCGWCSKCL